MSNKTFKSGINTYNISIYSAHSDGKKYPTLFLLHGNFGLVSPFGDQIQSFAKDLANKGYNTVVPQYYPDDNPHLTDADPDSKVQILTDAISTVTSYLEIDYNRIGLIGYSLGAAIAMTFISSKPSVKVKVLADFFGFITPKIRSAIASFPPTIIFHNKNDSIVHVSNSEEIDRLLPSTIEHQLIRYDEQWQQFNHVFQPNGSADIDSRSKTVNWLANHLPPTAS
jgi:dienelactone hydrolase